MTRMMTLDKEYLIVATAYIEKMIMASDADTAEQRFMRLVEQDKFDEILDDSVVIEVQEVVANKIYQER